MFKKSLVAVLAFGAIGAGQASAADLAAKPYFKAPPIAYLPWNRCYVGVSGGYITSTDGRTTITPNDPNLLISQTVGNVPTSLTSDPDGGIVGGTAGCNYQTGSTVLGVETDLSYTSLRSTSSVTQGFANVTTSYTHEMPVFGTLRGRLGYASGPTLFYGTAGLAYGDVKGSAFIAPPPALVARGAPVLAGSNDDWRIGWTVGAGIEHMISENWSVKGEYLYYDLGNSAVTALTISGAPSESGTFHHSNAGHIVRVGLNYQFGGR
jgi:outer membrane immunogenic protein